MLSCYNEITYVEDNAISNPNLYYDNGNRRVEHVKTCDEKIIDSILKLKGIQFIKDKKMSLSVLWNLPRKKYNENFQWVCVSGYLYNDYHFNPNSFVISDNIVNDADQEMAHAIIKLINEEVRKGNPKVKVSIANYDKKQTA